MKYESKALIHRIAEDILSNTLDNTKLQHKSDEVEEKITMPENLNVVIRKDLKEGKLYGAQDVTQDMLAFVGKDAKITGRDSSGYYYTIDLDNGMWAWTPEMFES